MPMSRAVRISWTVGSDCLILATASESFGNDIVICSATILIYFATVAATARRRSVPSIRSKAAFIAVLEDVLKHRRNALPCQSFLFCLMYSTDLPSRADCDVPKSL